MAVIRPDVEVAGATEQLAMVRWAVERFESVSTPGKYVSLSFWRDEAAILAWRAHVGHQHAQRKGRAEVFRDYRLSVVQVLRDYGMFDRDETPAPVPPTWGEDFPF